MVVNPYRDYRRESSNTFTRIFKEHTPDSELVWHRDRKDRTVKVLEGTDWKFQNDNKLPQVLSTGDIIKIQANCYHRIIKGKGDLVLEITEHSN